MIVHTSFIVGVRACHLSRMQPSQTFACALNTRVSIASRVGEQDTASMIRTHIFSREEDREQDTYSLFLHESVRRRSGLSHSRSQEVRAVSRREQWCPHVPFMHATHVHADSMRWTTSAYLPRRNQVLTAFWLRSCSHHVCSDKILRIMRHARPATLRGMRAPLHSAHACSTKSWHNLDFFLSPKPSVRQRSSAR